MTKTEALEILGSADVYGMSNVNPSMTCGAALEIVRAAVKCSPPKLSRLMEKRVWQVARNQQRPRY